MSDTKLLDRVIVELDVAVRSIAGVTRAARRSPAGDQASTLETNERERSVRLMRVNHVGEVCAQALYQAQALTTRDAGLREHFRQSAIEERDHLGWTAERLADLGGRPSRLNTLWYAGAFGLGAVAGLLGDRVSLGFVEETERQVERHLEGHLDRLPTSDHTSRAIVEQMKRDEADHAERAKERGASPLPRPVRFLMTVMAKVMTTTAARV